MASTSLPRHADLECRIRKPENIRNNVKFLKWSNFESQELETFFLDITGFQVGDGFMFNGKVDHDLQK